MVTPSHLTEVLRNALEYVTFVNSEFMAIKDYKDQCMELFQKEANELKSQWNQVQNHKRTLLEKESML